jgi:hypothetical protein
MRWGSARSTTIQARRERVASWEPAAWADDPKTSVIHRQVRVHGQHNCFVVSGVVYATVGMASRL